MRLKKNILFTCLLVVASSFHLLFAQKYSEKEAIKQTIDKLFTGMKKSDSTMVRGVFHPMAHLYTTYIDKQGIAQLKEESIDNFVKAVGTPHTEVYDERLLGYEILVDMPLATVWTPYEFYVGTKFSHCGVNAFQLTKTPEGWKIIHVTDTRRKEGCKVSKP